MLPTKEQLIEDLLEALLERVETGTDDDGRPEKFWTRGAKDQVGLFIDRLNDLPIQIDEVSQWLADKAKEFPQGPSLSFTLHSKDSLNKPITAYFFSQEGKYACGRGKTLAGAIDEALKNVPEAQSNLP